MVEKFLTTQEAADRLCLKKQTLEYWRLRGGGPAFLKFGRAVRYRLADIEAFVEASVRHSTSEAGA